MDNITNYRVCDYYLLKELCYLFDVYAALAWRLSAKQKHHWFKHKLWVFECFKVVRK